MRLMNLRTDNGRHLAVSPAHVRYIERYIERHPQMDRTRVYIVDEAIPLLVLGTFDRVVEEWHDALAGRATRDNEPDDSETNPDIRLDAEENSDLDPDLPW